MVVYMSKNIVQYINFLNKLKHSNKTYSILSVKT